MAISKQQPMRPGLVDAVDALNAATTAIEQLGEDLAAETARAGAAERANAGAIDQLGEGLAAETARAGAAERANAEAITLETARAGAAERANAEAISAETERAGAAEQALELRIGNLESEEHFYLYDFNVEYESKTILPISDPTPITGNNRLSVTIPEELQEGWKVASLLKYELFNESTRVDGVMCYQTTMGGQTELAAGFKTSGNAAATITKFTGELLLLKREEI